MNIKGQGTENNKQIMYGNINSASIVLEHTGINKYSDGQQTQSVK